MTIPLPMAQLDIKNILDLETTRSGGKYWRVLRKLEDESSIELSIYKKRDEETALRKKVLLNQENDKIAGTRRQLIGVVKNLVRQLNNYEKDN